MTDIQRYILTFNKIYKDIPSTMEKTKGYEGDYWIRESDHLKAISDKDVELRDCRTFIDFKLDDIRVRDEEIERLKQQIKEYENL